MAVDIVLPANLSIAEIETVYGDISSRLSEEGPIDLDAGAVERIDTAGVQLLLALIREGERNKRPTRWTATSDALLNCAEILGLKTALGL